MCLAHANRTPRAQCEGVRVSTACSYLLQVRRSQAVAVFSLLCGQKIKKPWGSKRGRPLRNRKEKSAVHARPNQTNKGIPPQTRENKTPKARLALLLDTRGGPILPFNSRHGGPLAGPQRANERQHLGPWWTSEAPSLGGRYSVPTSGNMWKKTTLGSPWLGLQSEPAIESQLKCEIRVPPNYAKYNQRKVKSENHLQQRPRYPSARGPITRRHQIHDPSARRGQRRAHKSRPATEAADPTAAYTSARACPPPDDHSHHTSPSASKKKQTAPLCDVKALWRPQLMLSDERLS